MSYDLTDYVDVATRITKFYERFEDGRIQTTPATVVTIGDKVFLSVTASVYRTPDDATPCIAGAWEPFPGRTPFTRDSEAMNAETSAIGRALAAAGVEVRRSLASADEVQSRSAPTDDELEARYTFKRLKSIAGTPTAERVKDAAHTAGRKLTEAELIGYPAWRAEVRELLDSIDGAP